MADDILAPCVTRSSTAMVLASDISRTLVGNKIIYHSDAFGASPVGIAPTTSSFWTLRLAPVDWAEAIAKQDEKCLNFGIWCDLY